MSEPRKRRSATQTEVWVISFTLAAVITAVLVGVWYAVVAVLA